MDKEIKVGGMISAKLHGESHCCCKPMLVGGGCGNIVDPQKDEVIIQSLVGKGGGNPIVKFESNMAEGMVAIWESGS